MQDGFYKSRPTAVDLGPYLIAGFEAGKVIVAGGPSVPFAGITDSVGGRAVDGVVDLQLTQEADVRYGGDVEAGDPLVASTDSSGRAIKLPQGGGQRLFCIGFAQVSGKADDIGKVLLAPHVVGA